MATKDSVPVSVDDTRDRLLLAAEEVFAAKGFEAASVRDILKLAHVKNIAAINYYFGDKERLYIETVKNADTCCNADIPFPEWPKGTPPEQKLRDFIHSFLQRMFQPQRRTAFQLILREMTYPTQACLEVVDQYIRPIAEVLGGILAELVPQVPEQKQFMIAFSIVGQCLHYRLSRAVSATLMGPEKFDQLTVDILAEHISEFSLNAIKAMQRPQAQGRQSLSSRGKTS
jgi:AcrR family transcriptional regulator